MICSDMLQCRKVLFLLVHFLVLVQWIFHNFRGPGNKPTNNNHVLGTLGKFQFFIVRELFTTKKSGKFLQLSGKFLQLSGKFLQLSGKFLQLSGNSLQPPFCLIVREKGIGRFSRLPVTTFWVTTVTNPRSSNVTRFPY